MQDKQIRRIRVDSEEPGSIRVSGPERPSSAPVPDKLDRSRQIRAKSTRRRKAAEDEVLAVIVDQRNGHTYYVSIIDNFKYKGIDYAVMYNYRAEDYERTMPEILIMRAFREHNEQYFSSIRDSKELNTIFDVFYNRYQESI